MFTWKVVLYNSGRKLELMVEAANQREALKFAVVRAPGYRASSAQRA